MKLFFQVVVVLMLFSVTAQGQHVFKAKYVPGKTYITGMTTTADMTMNFEGDSTVLASMRSAGMTFPMNVESSSSMKTITKTGNAPKNGNTPFVTEYVDVSSTQTLGDKVVDNSDKTLVGVKVFGYVDDKGSLKVDSVQGNQSPEFKEMIVNMMDQFQSNTVFPDRSLKIGDEFLEERPMEVPMAGGQTLKMTIKTRYKLAKVTGNEATFDLVQDLTLDMQMSGADAAATGGGKGVMKFNMRDSFTSYFQSDMDMHMKMNIQGMTMLIDGLTKTETTITMQ
jgi:hypothetical protein